MVGSVLQLFQHFGVGKTPVSQKRCSTSLRLPWTCCGAERPAGGSVVPRGGRLLVPCLPGALAFAPFWGHGAAPQNASRASRTFAPGRRQRAGFFLFCFVFQPQPTRSQPRGEISAGTRSRPRAAPPAQAGTHPRAHLEATVSQLFFPPYFKKKKAYIWQYPKRCSIQKIALLTSRGSFLKKKKKKHPKTQPRANSSSGPRSGAGGGTQLGLFGVRCAGFMSK